MIRKNLENIINFRHSFSGSFICMVSFKVYMTQNFFLLYFAVLYIQKPILNLKLA